MRSRAGIRSGSGAGNETPAKHFQQCGPFCQHVKLCDACSNAHGLCDAHRDDPDATFTWADPVWKGRP